MPEGSLRQNTDAAGLTVYYDGACPLCRAEINHYRQCDGADGIAFYDVAQPDAQTGPDLCRDAALKRFHVRRADGVLLSGARGFVEIWQILPKWRWAARIARLPGAVYVLEAGYRAFLPIRPALSRLAGRVLKH